MRRVLGDALVSAAALVILLVALVSIDVRVRERVAQIVEAGPSAGFGDVMTQAADVGSVVLTAIHRRSIDEAPMMIFIVAAAALVICMLRM